MASTPIETGPTVPAAEREAEEEMEVTVATQLENLIVTPGNADTPSEAHAHPEADAGDAHTHPEADAGDAYTHPEADAGDAHTHPEADAGDAYTHPEADAGDAHTHPEADMGDAHTSAMTTPTVEEDSKYDNSEDSDSDSSSSSSSTPTPRAPALEDEDDDEGFSQPAPIKTRDEVLLEELPAVEEVDVMLPEGADIQPIGTVSSIIQQLVIIQSLKDMPPLLDDSLIFNSDRLAVGKVFEVFGPVSSPLYVLRFNSAEQISSKGITLGQTVFYTPAIREYTGYVLTQQLQLVKGSDASWKNDQEPPPEALDYSDDEQEQDIKRKKKQNTKKKKDNNNTDNPAQIPHNALQQQQQQLHQHQQQQQHHQHQQQQHHHQHQQHNVRGFPPRHAGAPFRHQNPNQNHTPFRHTHTHIPPMYLPPPCPYPSPPPPPHFAPPNYPHYPPPPLHPPPSFCPPPLSSAPWPPHSIHADLSFSNFPPPPPPPPPPQ